MACCKGELCVQIFVPKEHWKKRLRTLKLIRRSSIAHLMLLLWLWPCGPTFAQTMGGRPIKSKKEKQEKQIIDPHLATLSGQLAFDEETKEALERSKTSGVLTAKNEEPGKIYQIEIVGAKKTEPDAVVLRLKSKVGHNFNPVIVGEDIIEIMNMGLFSDVKVWEKKLPSGAIVLRYELSEIPTIFQIKTVGNVAFNEDEIKESIAGLENYHVAKMSRIKENAEKIRDFYVSKGYFLATVDFKIEKTSSEDVKKREQEGLNDVSGSTLDLDTAHVVAPDFVDVIFTVKEHSKVRINRISFVGNTHLDDDLLKSI